jgi:isopentenyl phosphate kinase
VPERRNVILKLGGSAIAVKGDPVAEQEFYELLSMEKNQQISPKEAIAGAGKFLKWEVLEDLSSSILELRKQVDDLIIVHGAGIYGHALVSHFMHAARFEREFIGWPKTIATVTLQNLYIVNWLQSIGVPAIPFPPHVVFEGFWASFDGIVARNATMKNDDILISMLYRGYVPVLFGDMVTDKAGQFRVLSGDTLIPILVRELGGIDLVIAVSSFPPEVEREVAVYTKDPTDPNAIPIRKIFVSQIGNPTAQLENGMILPLQEALGLSTQKGTDVTGKMTAKVEELIECARHGVPGRILGPKQLLEALKDGPVGTEITPELT